MYTFNLNFVKIFILCIRKFYIYNILKYAKLFIHKTGIHNLFLIQSLNSILSMFPHLEVD